jgi:2-C-methyl-D-erythritol 4-phosphate cytidylyltransferase/2-C-methyl-D-erythritol 2,4-cyclodiphosphate synthase
VTSPSTPSARPGRTVALLVAAGSAARFGGPLPKQYLPLLGEPVLRRSAAVFCAHPGIDEVRIVINPAMSEPYHRAVAGLPVGAPIAGGSERQQSVLLGLEALAADGVPPQRVLVHDAARPLLPPEVIDRLLSALEAAPGAIAALPIVDTLWRAEGGESCGALVDRSGLWRAQTPQAFDFKRLLAAHRAAAGQNHTDDAAVLRAGGEEVTLVPGDEAAFKITTESDLARAEALLLARLPDIRMGTGFDVHRFGPGDHVVLCGIKVPHEQGLMGHSDADVGLHALADAIYGALGDGDIGAHFPPSDMKWRGADSAQFLEHAVALVRQRGGIVAHLDVTIMGEQPKVGPHRDAMRQRIAAIAGIDIGRVGVKATTTEKLGFTGRREGLAAQAAATIRLPL